MSSNFKPSIPKGTRDFGPEQMARRNFILKTIREVYEKAGFLPLETPAMENLDVLTGKYGEEGDQLLFKVLNSGDFRNGISNEGLDQPVSRLTFQIAEKGLRYDLTVPFARFVVMHQHEITMPFRRYQIQPVWRADRPQKGRYREFYQCDADIVGTDSLVCETELIMIITEVFQKLGLTDYSIRLNNRKVLSGIAEWLEVPQREGDLFVAIDKLDKIGAEKVIAELREKQFPEPSLHKLQEFLAFTGDSSAKIDYLQGLLQESETGSKGISELQTIFSYLEAAGTSGLKLDFEHTLARGLSYYTGAILEVKVNNVQIGSVGGGGRYDNLTGIFGLPGHSGIGFSFGVDRLYDVLEALDLFPAASTGDTLLLIACFDEPALKHGMKLLNSLRQEGIRCEIYPEPVKIKKQLTYANKRNIPFVTIIGEQEISSGRYSLKNMGSGEQQDLEMQPLIEYLKKADQAF
jgi:histidyl-tRNA synthetase